MWNPQPSFAVRMRYAGEASSPSRARHGGRWRAAIRTADSARLVCSGADFFGARDPPYLLFLQPYWLPYTMVSITTIEAMMSQTAKVFTNGRSQAVRLPAAFRFDTKEVFIRQDELTGDIILSRKPPDWKGFFAALDGVEVPSDFLSDRDQGDAGDRDPFADVRA